ncbi:hypothetical protein [Rhodococcus marinonascens]|uniref:hypothetical protein n=1 Tax=Rhodococcus marinonascens TaxID=38311 RepID=UPI000932C6AB|nr:hypothetical protein [Rhodococcus marinonascens]
MNFTRGTLAVAALAGAASLALAPVATASTIYQINPTPLIGTVYANNLVTLGALVTPTPASGDGTSPVLLEITEPDGDVNTRTIPLTFGLGTVATRTHEAGRYTAVFTFDPPNGTPAEATMEFDVVPSPFSGSS